MEVTEPRLFEASERRRLEAEALADLVRRGASHAEVQPVIELVTAKATKLLQADYAYVAFEAPQRGFIVRGLHGGISGIGDTVIPASADHPGQAVRGGRTVILQDLRDRHRHPLDQHPVHTAELGDTAVAAPLRAGHRLRGALVVGWRRSLAPNPEQVRLVEVLAGYAATILEAARARERERELTARAAAREAELEAVIRQIPSGVYVAGREGSIELMNDAAMRMLDLEGPVPATADLLRTPVVVRHPRTRRVLEPEETALRRALSGDRVEEEEVLLSKPEWAEDKLFEISALPLRDSAQTVTGAVVVFSDITRERQLMNELAESERRFRSLYGMVSCGVLVQDAEGRVVDANRPAEEILGRNLADMRGSRTGTLWKAVTEHGRVLAHQHRPTMQALREKLPIRGTVLSVDRPDGEVRWLRVDTMPVIDEHGKPVQVVSSFIDITERKEAEQRLAVSERQLRAIFEQAPIGLARVGLDGTVLEPNHVLQALLGYSAREFLGLGVSVLFGPSPLADDLAVMGEFAAGTRDTYRAERMVHRRDGSRLWASVSASLVRGNRGEPLYLIGILADFTEIKAQTDLLEHRALHDALTDLPNRSLLNDRLQQAILGASRDARPVALLLLDLNRFKDINDTFGHPLGDWLLQQIGPRIRALLRDSDTVARLGGDEFAVVLPTTGDDAGARLAAERILQAIDAPFSTGEQELKIGASIGIAICPLHGEDPAVLMRRADIAMYVAKRAKQGYAVYAMDQDLDVPTRLTTA